MSRSYLAFATAMLCLCQSAAMAQYKCVDAGGSVSFQQKPCGNGTSQQRISLPPRASPADPSASRPDYKAQLQELERRSQIRDAINMQRPMVSMTRSELDLAMGTPNAVNSSLYGSSQQDQLIYYRNGRTIYVYTREGVVTSIQDTAGSPVSTGMTNKPCPTASEIRDIEIEINKIANRGNQQLQTDLHRRHQDAKACR